MKFIYTLEVSGICNSKCSYCPYPTSKRKKGLMSISTFKKSLELVKKLNQNWICLHNFGEPLVHPKIVEFVKLTKKYVDNVVFSTNGVLLTRKLAIKLKNAGLTELYLSTHNLRVALSAMYNCRGLGILKQVRFLFFHDWAETAKNKTILSYLFRLTLKNNECCFIKKDWIVILWDGRINSCCIDIEGAGIIGSVFDKCPLKLRSKHSSICKNCHKPDYKTKKNFYKTLTTPKHPNY